MNEGSHKRLRLRNRAAIIANRRRLFCLALLAVVWATLQGGMAAANSRIQLTAGLGNFSVRSPALISTNRSLPWRSTRATPGSSANAPAGPSQAPHQPALPRQQSLDGDWNLWFDGEANWQAEEIILHPPAMAEVPVYPPSVGWDEMFKRGQPYRVPATWNELYPRKHGVGWYWRTVRIPPTAKGKTIRVRFRAVRLRAEVFWNRQLVGYSLEGSTPFEADITPFVHYGSDDVLAVRVTNPGGGTSSSDTYPIRWGKVALPDSRDCGGIWQDVDLLVTPPAFIQDVYVAPFDDLRTVRITATLANRGPARSGQVQYSIIDCSTSNVVAEVSANVTLKANAQEELTREIGIPNATLWSPENPHLYKLTARLSAHRSTDEWQTTFGVRFFTEKDGRLFLNGHRIFIRSAINFGYYPYTVIYPTPSLAEKEVRTAKALGLNMLSCHRSACTPVLLETADRLGLMIYEEPGGAPRERQPDPQSPAEAFERQAFLEKLDRLVVRDRNHPALIWWNLANEAFEDVVNDPRHLAPYIDQMMRTVHGLDPSRFLTYTSGRQSTVMFRPFEQNYGLIFDGHTVNNVPDVWRDALSIQHSTFEAPVAGEAFYNGESRCLTSLGDLPNLARQFANASDGSFEAEWRQWAYMLEKGFRQYGLDRYFDGSEELCRLIGIVQGTGFSREIEAIRLSDAASGLAINGWHSHPELLATVTGRDNKTRKYQAFWTSGLVDSLRNPNFPAEILARASEPLHLVVLPIPSTAFAGEPIRVRISLLNELHLRGPGQLTFQLIDPTGNSQVLTRHAIQLAGDPLRFVQDLTTEQETPQGASGYYRFHAELSLPNGQKLESERSVLVGNRAEWKLPNSGIAVQDLDTRPDLAKYFEAKSLFYPDHASPRTAWQPVEVFYDFETGDSQVEGWARNLAGLANSGKTILLWATDARHGHIVVEVLKKLGLLPTEAAAIPLEADWLGGWNFNTAHPVFAGLPAPVVYNQEFAGAFGYWGIKDFPGTLIAGLLNAPPQIAVTLGELPFRKGKVIVCALNLLPYLDKDPVADRIVAQLLNYAVTHANVSGDELRRAAAGGTASVGSQTPNQSDLP